MGNIIGDSFVGPLSFTSSSNSASHLVGINTISPEGLLQTSLISGINHSLLHCEDQNDNRLNFTVSGLSGSTNAGTIHLSSDKLLGLSGGSAVGGPGIANSSPFLFVTSNSLGVGMVPAAAPTVIPVLQVLRPTGKFGITIQADTGQQSDLVFYSPSGGTSQKLVQQVLDTSGNFSIRSLTDAAAVNKNLLYLNIDTGNVTMGNTGDAGYLLDVYQDSASVYAERIFHDGNATNRYGLLIQAGLDTPTTNGDCRWISFADGDGTEQAYMIFTTGVGCAIALPSDESLKKNIKDTDINGLQIINNLKIRQFDWKNEKKGHQKVGLIAQECLQSYPDMVHKGEDGLLGISESSLILPLLKAIQELTARVEELERNSCG